MSNYYSEYEEYYNSMLNKDKSKHIKLKNPFTFKGMYRRILQELIGGFTLFLLLLILKSNLFPGLVPALNYSKKIVHMNYNLEAVLSNVNGIENFKVEEIQKYVSDWIEQIKVNTVGGETIKEKVMNKYGLPFQVSSSKPAIATAGSTKAMDIEIPENTSVLSCYEGKVISLGEDAKLGKYIEIDHGEGIVIKYENLNEINVKNNDKVKKSDVIGKSGKATTNKAPHLQLEMSYMNETINPMEYINFNNKV